MQKICTAFLQIILVLIGLGALVFLLWMPRVEGVNAHATTFSEIYLDDPFLAYAYMASIPFFLALYQGIKLLGRVRQDQIFSQVTAKALRTIKLCAVAIIGFAMGGQIFILLAESDDRAGGVFMGILIILGAAVVAAAAAMLERILQDALSMRSKAI